MYNVYAMTYSIYVLYSLPKTNYARREEQSREICELFRRELNACVYIV